MIRTGYTEIDESLQTEMRGVLPLYESVDLKGNSYTEDNLNYVYVCEDANFDKYCSKNRFDGNKSKLVADRDVGNVALMLVHSDTPKSGIYISGMQDKQGKVKPLSMSTINKIASTYSIQ